MSNITEKSSQRSPKSRKRLTSTQRREKREALLRIYGRECWYCRRELAPKEITLDHLVPVGEGGSDHLANLRIACYPCNYSRHHNPPNPRFPEGFPRPKYFFGQWVRYHSMSGCINNKVTIRSYEGFIVGMNYRVPSRYTTVPGWRYELANVSENGDFYRVTGDCLESAIAPIIRKPLPPEQLQQLSVPHPNPQPPAKKIESCGEEINFSFRGWACRVLRTDEGWLSLIAEENKTNFIILCKAAPSPVDAVSRAVRQAMRMAPSSAMGGWLSELRTWGQLSKAEYENLHYSFHQGMKY